MSSTLLIDAHYLAWRAYYSTGSLSHQDRPTGVIFGFLRDVQQLQEQFYTHRLVFCFDGMASKRKEIYPLYKANRQVVTYTQLEIKNLKSMRRQITELRNEILPALGFKNIFIEDGFEGDDIIAACAKQRCRKEDMVVVTGDEDLYQLIDSRVIWYNPRLSKIVNLRKFREKYEIFPPDWPMVKALAGCKTDNIFGIKGVGEKTAIKYMQGKLPEARPVYKKIKESEAIIQRNLRLVELPFEGCPDFPIEEQEEISLAVWREVLHKYGIKSLQREFAQKGLF